MLAIDLGGTRVKAAMVDDGLVSELVVRDHGGGGLAQALACVDDLIASMPAADRIGLCLPGVVDQGRVVSLPGKLAGAVGFDLLGWLGDRCSGSALVVNDAIAYGVGESGDSPGRTVVVTIGTGVGTCVVEHGQPLGRGPLGGGQLSGQLPLTADGPIDTSGRTGTVEAWCRAERILEEVRAAGCMAQDVPGCFAAAAAGDVAALAGLRSYRSWLARGLASLCLAHAPDVVVVGGGPLSACSPLLTGLEELVLPLLWPGQSVTIRPARYGDAAALVGLEVLSR